MITVVGGIKGGSGKTTIATNLAVLRARDGKKVVLVDADEQKSASDWADQRTNISIGACQFLTISLAGKGINAQLQKLKEDYDDIIVDVGGRDTTSQRSALCVADVFIVPFKPRSLDIWTIGLAKTMISEISSINPNLTCLAVVNQADPSGKDNQDAIQIIAESSGITTLAFSIGNRKAFSNAASDGLGVCELKNLDRKAVHEIKTLYEHIYSVYKKPV